jgi:hypothetical protein
MASYVIDPETGERKKVSGTNYIPPCVVKNEKRKAEKLADPVIEPAQPDTEVDHG